MGCKEELVEQVIKEADGRALGAAKLDKFRQAAKDEAWDSIMDLNKLADKIFEASTIDKIQEAWMASILTSFTTLTANAIGNTLSFLLSSQRN